MTSHRVHLVIRAKDAASAAGAPIAAPRFLALLPGQWQPDVALDGPEIAVRFTMPSQMTVESLRTAARSALSDPALEGWELGRCEAEPAVGH